MKGVGTSALANDERGALAPLFLFILLFFVWAAVGILNTGQDTREKIEAQNATDAVSLAVSHQAARDMNVLAMNHVASSQSFTIAVSSVALSQSLIQTGLRAGMAAVESISRCRLKGWLKVICGFIAIRHGFYVADVVRTYSRYKPHRGVSVGNRITSALGRMNEHLVKTFPKRSSDIAKQLAEANRLKALFVYPSCSTSNGSDCQFDRSFPAPSLPVDPAQGLLGAKKLAATYDMCKGISDGSDGFQRLDFSQHGFPNGRGPLTGGGSDSDPGLREHINKASGLSRLIPSFYNFMRRTRWAVRYTRLSMHSTRQRANSNEFLDTFDAAWIAGCPNRLVGADTGVYSRSPLATAVVTGLVFATVTRPKNYWLKGRPEYAALSAGAGFAGAVGNSSVSEMTDFGFLYIGAKETGERSNPEDFEFQDEPYYAYSEALLFNEASHEMYSGRWNGNLVPSAHMNDPRRVAQAMGRSPGQASEDFRKLRLIMLEASNQADWRRVNAH